MTNKHNAVGCDSDAAGVSTVANDTQTASSGCVGAGNEYSHCTACDPSSECGCECEVTK